MNYPHQLFGTKTNWWLRFNPFRNILLNRQIVGSFRPNLLGENEKKHVIMRSKSDTNGPVSTIWIKVGTWRIWCWNHIYPKANFYNMFFFQDHNYLLLNESANYSLSNSPHMARKWHCSGNCTLWSPLTTPVHPIYPILGAKKRGRSVLWVCT